MMKILTLTLAMSLLLAGTDRCSAQCMEKISKSNNRKMRYQTIPLIGNEEYLSLSRTGEEKIFTYHNEIVELIFHVPMFTEVRFKSPGGNFSLYTTTSDRTFFNRSFTLSCPVTTTELAKMKGATEIEIFFPEEKKVYQLNARSRNLLEKALACVF
ncbi:hypothetical protein [Dyadobacter sandarakinus]|uniref:Uncharacterized protein n=1 Tax=Dyadobacter sandarakinus TaxID=2747268 RepID=A0ABX7I497_9BACT|nr:hypothetical protein [Dyadobacter sandarakinus]QRR00911.1 hypothetical protein HWI92_08350 [Dyadobacter sandarakinus]